MNEKKWTPRGLVGEKKTSMMRKKTVYFFSVNEKNKNISDMHFPGEVSPPVFIINV